MAKGRHSADRVAGHRLTTSASRKAGLGARKAPPEARKASPTRVGGARVAGRRVAEGDGRPVVLTALGSGEKLFALVPVAVLSVASVAGLAAIGNGDPASSAAPADSGVAASSPGHETARRQVPSRGTGPSARPTFSETAAPVVLDESAGSSTGSQTRHEQSVPTAQPTTPSSPVEPSAEPPVHREAEEPTAPAPTPSPTATSDPTEDDALSRDEATAQCLESGISTVDVLALAGCVDELLG